MWNGTNSVKNRCSRLAFLETLPLLEPAALRCRGFALGTSPPVAGFWRLLGPVLLGLTLVALQAPPLSTDELEQFFF